MLKALAIAAVATVLAAVPPALAAGRAGVVIGVVADGGHSFDIARSIARAVDHENELRVLPIAGKGPVQSLTDLVSLGGVDAAILPSDAPGFAKVNKLIENGKIAYVLKLASLDVHVVAGKNVAALGDLAAKRVAVGGTEGYAFVAASNIFAALDIGVELLPLEGAEALRAVAAGTADAAVFVGNEALLELVRPEDGLRLLSVPFDNALARTYTPSILSPEDYPGLLGREEFAESVAAALVVAVVDWPKRSPRHDKTARFAQALLEAFASEEGGDAGLNLAADVPGWKRFEIAEEWLASRRKSAEQNGAANPVTEN